MGLYLNTPPSDAYRNVLAESKKEDRVNPLYIIPGAIDTVGQSLGLLDEGDMAGFLSGLDVVGAGSYANHETGYRAAGDVLTLFGGVGAVTKVGKAANLLTQGRKLGILGRTTTAIIPDYIKAEKAVAKYEAFAEASGAAGITNLDALVAGKAAKKAARVASVTTGAKEAALSEAFVLGTLNESDLFGTKGMDTTDITVYSGAGFIIGTALHLGSTNKLLRKAAGKAGDEAEKLGREIGSQSGLNFLTAQATKESAGGVTLSKFGQDNPDVGTFISQAKASAEETQKKAVFSLRAADVPHTPFGPVGENVLGTDGELVRTLDGLAKSDPKIVGNMVSIGEVPAGTKFNQTRQLQVVFEQSKDSPDLGLIYDLTQGLESITINKLGHVDTPVEMGNKSFYLTPNTRVVKKVGAVSGKVDKEASYVYTTTHKGLPDRDARGITIGGRVVGGKVNEALSPLESSRVYSAMPSALKAAQKFMDKSGAISKGRHILGKNSPHESFDFAVELLRQNNNDMTQVSKVIDLSGYSSVDEVVKAGLDKKLRRFKLMRNENLKAIREGKDIPYSGVDMGNILMFRFSDIGGENAGLKWFEDLASAKATEVGPDLETAYTDFLHHALMEAPEDAVISKLSNPMTSAEEMLNLPWKEKLTQGNTPFSALVRKSSLEGDFVYNFAEIRATNRARESVRQSRLGNALKDNIRLGFLGEINNRLDALPTLLDSAEQGARRLSQSAIDGPVLSRAGQLIPTTLTRATRDVQGADAVSGIADIVHRNVKTHGKQYMAKNLNAVRSLLDPKNADSALQYLHYESAMQRGWVLEDGVVDEAGRLLLNQDDPRNITIVNQFNSQGGKLDGVPKYLPEPVDTVNPEPLVLSGKAKAAYGEMVAIGEIKYDAEAVFRRSMGLAVTERRLGYTPTVGKGTQEMAFVTRADGSVVDVAYGRNAAKAEEAALDMARERNKNIGSGHGVVTRDSVGAWKQAMDEAWNSHTIDVTDAYSLTSGRQARGTRRGLIGDVKYIENQIAEVTNIFERIGSQFTEAKFAGQIENVKAMQAAQTTGKEFKEGISSDIYDQWLSLLTNTTVRHKNSVIGKLSNTVEQVMDVTVGKALDLVDGLPVKGGVSPEMQKAGERLAREYGYDPVGYAISMAEREVGVNLDGTARKYLKKMGVITQTLALKMFELAHASLTLASTLTTTPHTIQWYKPLAGETLEQTKSRLGWAGEHIGNGVHVPNSMGISITTMGKIFRGDFKHVISEARSLGYLDAPISEFVDMVANPNPGKGRKFFDKFIELSGWASTKSEEFSRMTSFLTGYNYFRKVGNNTHEVAMALANDVANKAIADYRPHIRGEAFKGTAGIPIAMFQTFSINYMERMALAIENKAMATAFVQNGTQAFMFGTQSLPGYDVVNETVLANWDQTKRPEDLLNSNDNPALSAFMKFGFASTLPMMLGAGDGVDLSQRGSMSTPRNISPFDLKNSPMVSMVTRIVSGLSRTIKSTAQGDGTLALDNVIYGIPSRTIRSALEGIRGEAVDSRGNVINTEVEDFASMVRATVGLKPITEANMADVVWRNKLIKVSRRSAIRELGDKVRGAVRAGNGKISGAEMRKVVNDYFAYGGSVSGFASWYKGVVNRAMVSEFDRAKLKALRSKDMEGWRRFTKVE